MQIKYPDGQSIMVDPDRKPSGIVSEVILVDSKLQHLSLDCVIQSASARAVESHSADKAPLRESTVER